jgi:hypothetical protein
MVSPNWNLSAEENEDYKTVAIQILSPESLEIKVLNK